MQVKKKNLLKRQLDSFKYAFQGIKTLLKTERNARIHCIIAIGTIILGIYVHLSPIEWIIITLCIGLVIAFEAINTAIENTINFISLEQHQAIKKIKDLAAGAVLIVALMAFIVGLLVFIPKFGN